ncbi:hypothetical protein ABL78_6136 [Leptomonas seymouri]|uniref:Uncharacterized protein n=1 Tax=Leptomonas seymouri TaxID=5684 RepID=A0A0N1PC02_LEPSE|nr:hypothetical protein ABL78_6136 [Leptomonas seymouri]|eukprot:KPI84808.1 hypothetical protein ABL78_6136 [Leptomonas seymouri]
MYFFDLILGHEPRLLDRRRSDRLDDAKGVTATSTQFADESLGDTGSMMTADTAIDPVPMAYTSRSRSGDRWARHRSHSLASPQDRLSLWSRLMCQPEVFDPHVEAAPVPCLMEVSGATASPLRGDNRRRSILSQSRRDGKPGDGGGVAIVLPFAASSEVQMAEVGLEAAAAATLDDDEPLTEESESSLSSDSLSEESSSPVSSVEGLVAEVEVAGKEVLPLLSVPMANEMPTQKPLHAFRVTDTRRCRCHFPHALLFSDSSSTANTSFARSCPLDCHSGVESTTPTIPCSTAERLVARQELAVKRSQRRQQVKEAARRQREYKTAWAELVALERDRASGHLAAGALTEGTRAKKGEEGEGSVPNAKPIDAVVTVPLTNEALESHRGHVMSPLYELPTEFWVRVGRSKESTIKYDRKAEGRIAGGGGADKAVIHAQRSSSGGSDAGDGIDSVVVIEDEDMGMMSPLPVMHGTGPRFSEAAEKGSATAAEAAAVARMHSAGRVPVRKMDSTDVQAGADGLQRTPSGKYPLGSRGYVEHVMFALRRQQECALFFLLTEAHRQARAAHLRLAQMYYYYILPILAQYQVPEEVEGLANSLLQCGSGSLRAFHSEFCKTVPVGNMYDYLHGTFVPTNLVLVQPVDYQSAQYRFENPWRELFHEIKSFLGMQPREDASTATLSTKSFGEEVEGDAKCFGHSVSPAKGSVCMAATVLHSMELFERVRHTQSATRDAEDWLAWYCCCFTPQVEAATTLEARSAVVRSLLPIPVAAPEDGVTVPPHPLEREYLPMVWSRVCQTAEREEVLGYRRALKLEVMEKAMVSLQFDAHGSKLASAPSAVATKATQEVFVATALRETAGDAVAPEKTGSTTKNATEVGCDAITAEAESNAKTVYDGVALESEEMELPCLTPSFSPLASPQEELELALWCSLQPDPTFVSTDASTGRIKNGAVVAGGGGLGMKRIAVMVSHQKVDVGCFGFSFFSFF